MIDLSRLPAPLIIEALDYEGLQSSFISRFLASWADLRAIYPDLPAYDVEVLETDPVVIVSQAWSYLRLLDRARVNDAIKAVLAPLATGSDLDNVAARVGVERLVVAPATGSAPAVLESDARLLTRYLLAMTRPAAGSRDRYRLEALTAWPGLHDVAVRGHAVHGRAGDVDIVIAGPEGRDSTDDELAVVRAACTADDVVPEATGAYVRRADRRVYAVTGHVVVPSGPDAETIRQEVVSRIRAAATERLQIGAEVPRSLLSGAAYGASIVRVDLVHPVSDIAPDPYTIPVLGDVTITVQVQA
ncbi:baseplate assembly protein [Xanthobacter sp. TB0136]|uniref:baseplate assembly protein n=1 Tax=Xanthobacter sp. TB0136 TaxID=3459177 RepID=UPI00403A4910